MTRLAVTQKEKIVQDIQCVLDTTNFDGHEVQDGSADLGHATCYPREQYEQIRWDHYGNELI